MRILGISAFYHDSAAALLVDGRIVAAAQEERFTRKKHDARFPVHAIAYCLAEGGCKLDDVDYVVFYDKPFLKFERLLETYVALRAARLPLVRDGDAVWIREKLFQKDLIRRELQKLAPDFDWQNRLLFTEHHLSHAASAFYPSPFEEAAVLTMDGVGEWARPRPRRPRQRARDSSRSCTSRIRSGCSIPHSPITPASRSIPASTS